MEQLYAAAQNAEGYICMKCSTYSADRAAGHAITITWPGEHRVHIHAHAANEAIYKITLAPWQPGGPLSPGRGGKNG